MEKPAEAPHWESRSTAFEESEISSPPSLKSSGSMRISTWISIASSLQLLSRVENFVKKFRMSDSCFAQEDEVLKSQERCFLFRLLTERPSDLNVFQVVCFQSSFSGLRINRITLNMWLFYSGSMEGRGASPLLVMALAVTGRVAKWFRGLDVEKSTFSLSLRLVLNIQQSCPLIRLP